MSVSLRTSQLVRVKQSEISLLKAPVHDSIYNSTPLDYPEPSKSLPSVESRSFIYDLHYRHFSIRFWLTAHLLL